MELKARITELIKRPYHLSVDCYCKRVLTGPSPVISPTCKRICLSFKWWLSPQIEIWSCYFRSWSPSTISRCFGTESSLVSRLFKTFVALAPACPHGSPAELLMASQTSVCLWPLWTIICSVPFPGKPFCDLQTSSGFTWVKVSRWITPSKSSKSLDLQWQSHFQKQLQKMWIPKFRLVSVLSIHIKIQLNLMVWDNIENSEHWELARIH